jgi:hypothetical protein
MSIRTRSASPASRVCRHRATSRRASLCPEHGQQELTARVAPASCASTYPKQRRQGKSRRSAKAIDTTGFRCAPDMAPMKRVTAITVSPGAVTAEARLIQPVSVPATAAPALANTSRKVPRISESSRRHSGAGSSKSRVEGLSSARSASRARRPSARAYAVSRLPGSVARSRASTSRHPRQRPASRRHCGRDRARATH